MGERRPLSPDLAAKQWPLLVVIGVAALGLVAVAVGHWRLGAAIFGLSLVVASVLRAVRPSSEAGLLQVRSKAVDVTLTGTVAVMVLVLAVLIPPPLLPIG